MKSLLLFALLASFSSAAAQDTAPDSALVTHHRDPFSGEESWRLTLHARDCVNREGKRSRNTMSLFFAYARQDTTASTGSLLMTIVYPSARASIGDVQQAVMLVDGDLWTPLILYAKTDTLTYFVRRAEGARLTAAKVVHGRLRATRGRCEFTLNGEDQRKLRLLLHAVAKISGH